MGFYQSLLIGTVVSLIIVLAIMGVMLGNSISTQTYPPQYSSCPDYYTMSTDGVTCTSNLNIYSNVTDDCKNKSFNTNNFNIGGTGPQSGLCAKKTWANNCGVAWDGITNNSDICYKT